MRKNMSYLANIPSTRNDFIDCVNTQKDVILVNNTLLKELVGEINDNVGTGKAGKAFKTAGPIMLALSWWNPVGLICGGVVTICGALAELSNDFKKYKIYAGTDIFGNDIIVLHRKSINLNYDTIEYPEWVDKIDYQHKNKKICIK